MPDDKTPALRRRKRPNTPVRRRGGPLVPATYPSADRNPAVVYLASLATGSRRTMRHALNVVAQLITDDRCDAMSMPWHRLQYQHTTAVRARLAELFAPATANKMLAAMRGVLKQAWRLGYIDGETYQRTVDLPTIRGKREPAGRALTPGELRDLFRVCADAGPGGVRDAAAFALLYGAGLRRSEAVTLDLDHVDLAAEEIRIIGKGNRERIVPITNGTTDAVAAWVHLRGDAPGPLLCPVLKSGRITPRRMTDQALLAALLKRAAQAGVKKLSPHDLRRSFITHMLDAGADALSVQKLAGHANTQTTLRYDRRDEKAKRRAAELLRVPFVAAR